MKIKDFFYFSRRERNGILILLIILLLSLLLPLSLPLLVKKEQRDFSQFDSLIEDIEKSMALGKQENLFEKQKKTFYESFKNKTVRLNPFPFNPNQLPIEDWIRLGIPPRLAATIKNYEAKGGFFRKKEDLKKIYGMTEQMYSELEPYIIIPETTNDKYPNKTSAIGLKTSFPLALNSSDSSDLIAINGIGPVFAQRIIKYRNALGGFHSVQQLKEVYGMDSTRYKLIYPFVYIENEGVIKMNINTASEEILSKHPYIRKNVAKSIVAYRNQHGAYQKESDLMNSYLIDSVLYKKILPYIKTE